MRQNNLSGRFDHCAPSGLFQYGIHQEKSDIRAHVSPVDKTIYIFKTEDGRKAIKKFNPQKVPAMQSGYKKVTATGYLIKLNWIENLKRIRFETWPRWNEFSKYLDTSQKGKLAMDCVRDCIKSGLIPFGAKILEIRDKDMQIQGTDIILFCQRKIQIKCDYPIGNTGNLFLQDEEINPLNKI